MATFSFNTDIAPLRSQFFPVGGMRQSEFRQLMGGYTQSILPLQEENMKMANNLLNLQQQELAYERSQLALATARRRSKMELDAMGKMPQISARLGEIAQDPSTDSFEKMKEINQLKMNFASTLQYSPAMQDMFSSAAGMVQSDLNKQKYDEAEKRRSQGAIYQIAQLGCDVEPYITDPASEGGATVTPNERVYQGLSQEMRGRETLKKETALAKARQDADQRFRTDRKAVLKDFSATLKGLDVIDDDFVANFDRTGQTQMPQIKDTSLEYDAKSRQQLEEMMFALNPSLDEEFVRQASNEDLTRATIRTINNELIRLSPPMADPPSPAATTIGTAFST